MQRNTSNARRLYDLLNTRFNELNAEAGVQANNVSVVDRADRPLKPVKTSIIFNMALSLLAGLIFAALFVVGRAQLFNVIRTPDDVGRTLGMPSLDAIPTLPEDFATRQELIATNSLISDNFRQPARRYGEECGR